MTTSGGVLDSAYDLQEYECDVGEDYFVRSHAYPASPFQERTYNKGDLRID